MLQNDLTPENFKEKILTYFDDSSPLIDAPSFGGQPYEDRPQQKIMAREIAESLYEKYHLCVEAATGTGKSFAYLIPAIHYAHYIKKPVVIATHTIALQEQLINKDIPILKNLLNIDFTVALAKGRENYLCLKRLKNLGDNIHELLPSDKLIPEFKRLQQWSMDSDDGTRSDLEFKPTDQLWSLVCNELGGCNNEFSGANKHCFFLKARKQLYTADIIIANHALYCSDLALRLESNFTQKVLPDYHAVIIDEAHSFEETAATHLGIRVSRLGIFYLLNRLFNPRTNRGFLVKSGLLNARMACIQARENIDSFFKKLEIWLDQQSQNPLVYNTPGHIPNTFKHSWTVFLLELQNIIDDDEFDGDFKLEIDNFRNRLSRFYEGVDIFLNVKLDQFVYWFDIEGKGQRNIILNAVPLKTNEILKNVMFNQNFSVIMTSATLAYKNDLSHFQHRTGVDNALGIILDTPFDYKNNVDLYVPFSKIPDPGSENYSAAVSKYIKEFIIKSNGKAFVLFTSYSAMDSAAIELKDFFDINKIKLLIQGHELPRSKMIEIFRTDVNSVIFGTASFWEGIDIPGQSLSNVIIVKLPFSVPTHPLVHAKQEMIKAEGGNPFNNYFLPDAVLKFRQGVGRLVRSKYDTGMIVVLDPRIITSNYGKVFLESIPDCRRHIF